VIARRLLNIVWALTLMVGCAGGLLWHLELRAPAPEKVCAHLQRLGALARADVGVDSTRCVHRLQPPKFGLRPYVRRMKCMQSAGSFSVAMRCRVRA
jgi:hypothetical protein